jgi:hypothetical protein
MKQGRFPWESPLRLCVKYRLHQNHRHRVSYGNASRVWNFPDKQDGQLTVRPEFRDSTAPITFS